MSEMTERLTFRDENGKAFAKLDLYTDADEVIEFGRLSLEKLCRYEESEKQGVLIKLPCKVEEVIDRLFSHNEIIALWYKKPNDKQNSYRLWKGMAWDLPERYKELRFIKVFGVVSETISESDTINLLVAPYVIPAYENHAGAEKGIAP